MDWAALPDPLGAVLGVVVQAAPSGGVDGGDTLVTSLISAIGGAGLSTAILWRIHAEDRKVISQLTSRLFLLADRGMAATTVATEVVQAEAKNKDADLLAEMQRLAALLDERGSG